MALQPDFTKLKATTFQSGNEEEAVTVDTRALIDKVLARYSGEWTTLRELIQNAADAQASTVQIRFETIPSSTIPLPSTTNPSENLKHTLLNHTLRRLVVTNDGQVFGVNDWARLKRIAEGNPDETKIGAFGVGFYSVFADCEEPFVSSGNQAMAFYWKSNALFTKKAQLPEEQSSRNTSFVLEYRNTTTPMINLLSVAQFLATSLTFVALQHLELYVDDWKIISIHKKVAPGVEVAIGRNIITGSKQGLMKVDNLQRESVQMDATFMNVIGWKPAPSTLNPKLPGSYDNQYGSSSTDGSLIRSFFSKFTPTSSQDKAKAKAAQAEQEFQNIVLEDVTATTTVNVFLGVTTATVKTSIAASFATELERATKKPPPKITRPAILTSSYDEAKASSEVNEIAKGVDVFASVLPQRQPGGRIFIGFPTHQTTGAGMHLSAPSVIPTVERESIDLNARWVRTWNEEMLRCAGIMTRLAYTNEMNDLSDALKRATQRGGHGDKVTKQEVEEFTARALHIFNTFAFSESTPSAKVSPLIEESFWLASKTTDIEIFSTRGVLSTKQVRLPTDDFSGFVDGIPVVPASLVETKFVKKLIEYNVITEITITDVTMELQAKTLDTAQLKEFISWAARKALNGEIDRPVIHSLMESAVATTDNASGSGGVITLGTVTAYLDAQRIPSTVPIPTHCIPFQFTQHCRAHELQALGWEPLELVPWLRFLVETNIHRPDDQNYTKNVAFAATILQILSRGWDTLGPKPKDTVVQLLQHVTIIPTKAGMKRPGEAYLAHVKLFDDLPTIVSCPGVKEKFLAALGVRKTVELDTVFRRLLAPPSDDIVDDTASGTRFMELVNYLASVQKDIPAEDMKKLQGAKFCPAEAGPKGMEASRGSARKYRVNELFAPNETLRDLGLPLLRWPGPPGSYRPRSDVGMFLIALGLKSYPSVPELVTMMVAASSQWPNKPMEYFIANHVNNRYENFTLATSTEKFLPLESSSRAAVEVVSPRECFTNIECQILGFKILKKELHIHANKFGVILDPPIGECIRKLIANPPTDHGSAKKFYEYFSRRINELGDNAVALLVNAQIIPVVTKPTISKASSDDKLSGRHTLKMLSPRQCYIGSSSAYGEIFDFVDFGSTGNAFLFKCGSKTEPTIFELATLACSEPARLLGAMQSPEKYLNLLRKFADDSNLLKRDRQLWTRMKSAKFLLGEIEVPISNDQRRTSRSISKFDEDNSDNEDNDSSVSRQLKLASAAEIVVVDDFVSYRLFKSTLVVAVEDEKLEKFYIALGSSNLSELLQVSLRLGYPSEKQESAVVLRSHVLERAKIFLHEFKRDETKHDYRWLEHNLTVQVVQSIQLRRSLKGIDKSHQEVRSAALQKTYNTHTLFITSKNANLYEISSSICNLLLERPSQGHMITFEQFLSLNLVQLKIRGYNVDRILRAKLAEKKIAEEERLKQIAQEQEELRQLETQRADTHNQQQVQKALPQRPQSKDEHDHLMPGSFGADSPNGSPPADNSRFSLSKFIPKGMANLGRDLTKQLGNGSSASSNSQEQEDENRHPNNHANGSDPYSDNPKPKPTKTQEKKKGTGEAMTPTQIHNELMKAIGAARPHDSDRIVAQAETTLIDASENYCDESGSANLTYVGRTANSTKFFVTKNLPDPKQFCLDNSASINKFAALLLEICEIYRMGTTAMHISYEPESKTIAFNTGGSIFCNFHYYLMLHRDVGRDVSGPYWWVIVAHELAHNLHHNHDSNHSFITEQLIVTHYPRMLEKSEAWKTNFSQ